MTTITVTGKSGKVHKFHYIPEKGQYLHDVPIGNTKTFRRHQITAEVFEAARSYIKSNSK